MLGDARDTEASRGSKAVGGVATGAQAKMQAAPWAASSWMMAVPMGCRAPVTTQTKPYWRVVG